MTVSEASAPAIHPRLERLFGGFDRERLAWALLRGESELGAPAGDIDILVAPGHAERLRDVASASGFARLPAPGHASHVFLIAYDEPTGTWFKLDVVTELAFGPSFAYRLPSVPAGSCLDRRRRVGAAYGLDPRDAFWARLLHALLDKPRIEDGEIAELAGPGRRGPRGGSAGQVDRPPAPRRMVDRPGRRRRRAERPDGARCGPCRARPILAPPVPGRHHDAADRDDRRGGASPGSPGSATHAVSRSCSSERPSSRNASPPDCATACRCRSASWAARRRRRRWRAGCDGRSTRVRVSWSAARSSRRPWTSRREAWIS